jgi:hypothetical protein
VILIVVFRWTIRRPLAAPADAMQVRAANEPPGPGDVVTTYAQMPSGFGQITVGAAPRQAVRIYRRRSLGNGDAQRPNPGAYPAAPRNRVG